MGSPLLRMERLPRRASSPSIPGVWGAAICLLYTRMGAGLVGIASGVARAMQERRSRLRREVRICRAVSPLTLRTEDVAMVGKLVLGHGVMPVEGRENAL